MCSRVIESLAEPIRKSAGNKLTAMMQVRNEADRFLPEVLNELCTFVDEIVIVDDASTDDTVSICAACPKVVELVRLPASLFAQEWRLRAFLWETAIATRPDWLLAVDADELYERRAKESIRSLIEQDQYDWISFRFFDLWGGLTHYREDEWWNNHLRHTASLVRVLPGFPAVFPTMDHHVPRIPLSYRVLPGLKTDLRVKHLGWACSLEERVRKYQRYRRMDPNGRFGSLAQYDSILDLSPNLIEWKEEM